MINFLITAANSDISIGIARILRLEFPKSTVIGVAPDGNLPGSYFFDKIYTVPLVSDFYTYKDVLHSIMAECNINVLCPVSEKELSIYKEKNYVPLPKILINPPEILENFLDKYKTYNWLKKRGIPVPETFPLSDPFPYLFKEYIIKPRSSAGSKNMYYVEDKNLFNAIRKSLRNQMNDFVVQRCVGSKEEEYTCALWRFSNAYREIILKRKLLGGLTGEAEVVINSDISAVLEKIAENINGNFFINVQLRLEKGIPYIFEINPRFSSTVMLRHKVGFQDVLWSFRSLLNKNELPYVAPKVGTKLYRISEELIIDEKKVLNS